MFVLLLLLALQDPVSDAVRGLSGDDIGTREQAERDLALLGDPAARELEQLLTSEDVDLAARARRALTMNGRRRCLPESLCRREPAVLDRDWTLAELLALKLTPDEEAFFGPRAARDWTLPAATWLRVARGRGRAADYAEAAKRAPQEALRAVALAALGDVDALSAVRLAAECLRSTLPVLRAAALRTLGDVGPASAAGDVKRFIKDPTEAVAVAAKAALEKLEKRNTK